MNSAIKHMVGQPGELRAFKIVSYEYRSPFAVEFNAEPFTYKVGETYTEPNADTNAKHLCGKGIHVATWDWVVAMWRTESGSRLCCNRVLEVGFHKPDIAAIPDGSDGKIRLRRCRVIREVPQKELNAFGLHRIPPPGWVEISTYCMTGTTSYVMATVSC